MPFLEIGDQISLEPMIVLNEGFEKRGLSNVRPFYMSGVSRNTKTLPDFSLQSGSKEKWITKENF